MKANVIGFVFLLMGLAVLQSCSNEQKGHNATIMEKQQASEAKGSIFLVDTSASRIRFTGYGVGKKHPGIFKLSSGSVAISGDEITGGNFVINIM